MCQPDAPSIVGLRIVKGAKGDGVAPTSFGSAQWRLRGWAFGLRVLGLIGFRVYRV